MFKYYLFILLLVFQNASFAETIEDDSVEVKAEASYLMRGNDSKELARALVLFEAKRKAVDIGAKYLATKGLIEIFEERKKEIYALVAGEVETEIVEEKWLSIGQTFQCFIRIISRVKDSDFIRGEARDKALEEEEFKETFKEEMDPTIAEEMDPSKEIAKAYRLIRERKWRMAIIYLDRLEVKYPNWGEIYMVKAIGYYALHKPRRMKRSLEKACDLENQEACEDLKRLKKVHSLDLDN